MWWRRELAFFDKLPPHISHLRSEVIHNPIGCIFNLLHLSGEVVSRRGNCGNANSCGLPGDRFVQLGNGNVEAVAQLFLEAANHLAAILKRMRVLNTQLDGHGGNGHRVYGTAGVGAVIRLDELPDRKRR